MIHDPLRSFLIALLLLYPFAVSSAPNPNPDRRWNGKLETRAVHNVTANNKAGLAWNNPQTTQMAPFFRTGKVGWYYTWSSWSNDQGRNLDFVPLLWGKDRLTDWKTAVSGRLKPMFQNKDITCVLGFNEPQERGQSNMTPQDAKTLWIDNLLPLKTQYGVRLGSPATSSAPSGKNWTQQFLQVCGTDCSVDFIALHYYGTNATAMIEYITDFHNTFQMPIWVTEWACQDFTPTNKQCTQEETSEYMNITKTFMESAPWLERYAWFGALTDNPIHSTNDLLTDSGHITSLGQQYIGMTQEQIDQGNASSTTVSASSSPTSPITSSTPASTFTRTRTLDYLATDGGDSYPPFSISGSSRTADNSGFVGLLMKSLPALFALIYLLEVVV